MHMPDQFKFTPFAKDLLQLVDLFGAKLKNLAALEAFHVVMMGMAHGVFVTGMPLFRIGFSDQSRLDQMR